MQLGTYTHERESARPHEGDVHARSSDERGENPAGVERMRCPHCKSEIDLRLSTWEEAQRVVSMSESKMSVPAIAREMGFSKGYVNKLRRFMRLLTIREKKAWQSGDPSMTTERMVALCRGRTNPAGVGR